MPQPLAQPVSERSERMAVNSPSMSLDLRRVIASCLDMRKSRWLEEAGFGHAQNSAA